VHTLRIGIITTWFERGGGYVGKQYAEALATEHDVFVYARGGEEFARGHPDWDFDYVTWGTPPVRGIPMPIDLGHLKKWIIQNRIEIAFFNEQKDFIPVVECSKMGLIVGSYIDYYTPETVPLFASFDFLVCNTRRHQEAFSWHSQCYYIPWGTDTNLFQPRLREDYSLQTPVFFHSAGMNPFRKGTDLLIKAFSMMNQNAHLIIHSQVSITKIFPELRDTIEELTNQKKLEIIQKTVKAPGLYHLGDIYVYPSRLEGIGLTIAEALSCGLPVITTDCQPMNEFVTNEVGALIGVEEYKTREDNYFWNESIISVEQLTEIMQNFAEHPERIEEMKKQARMHALENLDWFKNVAILPSLINETKRIESEKKTNAQRRAVAREKLSLLRRLFYRSPRLYRMIFNVWGLFKELIGVGGS